jgi:hypothetical protein
MRLPPPWVVRGRQLLLGRLSRRPLAAAGLLPERGSACPA